MMENSDKKYRNLYYCSIHLQRLRIDIHIFTMQKHKLPNFKKTFNPKVL